MVAGVGEPRLSISQVLGNSANQYLERPRVEYFAPARERRKRWVRVIATTDTLISTLVVFAAVLPATRGSVFEALVFATAVVAFWGAALSFKGTRQRQYLGVGSEEYKKVFEAGLLTAGVASIAGLVLPGQFTGAIVLQGILPGIVALLGSRWVMRRTLHARARRGKTLSRVIVIGNTGDIHYLINKVGKNSAAIYQVVGAIEDTGNPLELDEIPTATSMDALDAMLLAYGVDAVIVAGELNEGARGLTRLGWNLEKSGTELIVASRLTNVAGPRIKVRPVEGLPLMHVDPPVFSGGRMWAKRLMDMSLAAVALLVLAPVFSMIALAVRLESRGPVVFSQTRVGKDGSEFTMFKFRTMVVNAEELLDGLKLQNEGAGPLFKMKNDPRVTRVGRVLRKLSLDELPQIYNVLRGDMSLVGPRPPLQSEVDAYESDTCRRLLIRPGLTGLWQTRGRSDLSWEESVALDLYYVENWSVIGDVVIMWHTAKAMIQPQGAY